MNRWIDQKEILEISIENVEETEFFINSQMHRNQENIQLHYYYL